MNTTIISLTNDITIDFKKAIVNKKLKNNVLEFIDVKNKFQVLTNIKIKHPLIIEFELINAQKNISVDLKFLKNAQPLTLNAINNDDIAAVAKLIIEFQKNSKTNIKKWPYKKLYYFFKSKIKKPLWNLEKYENYIVDLSLPTEWVMSHNDLNVGNIIKEYNRYYLIDFDFAMQNDPLFDVASFISECNLSKINVDFFYNFLNIKTDSEIKRINYLINYQNLLWCAWANYMFDQTNDKNYYQIALHKYQNLNKK